MHRAFPQIVGQEAFDTASNLCRQVGELTLSRLIESLSELLKRGDSYWVVTATIWAARERGRDGPGIELSSGLDEMMFDLLPLPAVGCSIYLPWEETGQFLEKAGPHKLVPYVELPDSTRVALMQLIAFINNNEIGMAQVTVMPDDVLISIKGANRKVSLVPRAADSEVSWVIGQSLCIIRCGHGPVTPKVLTTFLRSPLGQQLFDQITTGSAVPFVQLKELRSLLIPIPDPVRQRRIEKAFDEQVELLEEIRQIEDSIRDLTPDEWKL